MIFKNLFKRLKMEETNSYLEAKKEMKRQELIILKGVANSIENVFNRQKKVDDPCLRSCLFVDKLSLVMDILLGFLNSQSDEDLSIDMKVQLERISKIVNVELDNLMTWCRNPTFSPDEPYGKHIMKTATFYNNANENDSQ